MGKIKLNLVSGAVVEKPLVNAFIANNNKYVVLDNEMNGSMGLPIILVSKIESNKLTKIVDQNEWQLVKEYLKNVIAGASMQFVAVNNEIAADDIYYTQLTLPVPSFDALKNAYKVAGEPNAPVSEPAPSPVEQAPTVAPAPVETQAPAVETPLNDVPISPLPAASPEAPVAEVVTAPATPTTPEVTPVESTPTVDNTILGDIAVPNYNEPAASEPVSIMDINIPTPTPDAPSVAPIAAPAAPTAPEVTPTVEEPVRVQTEPEITPTPIIDTSNLVNATPDTSKDAFYEEEKKAFLQACENMFDALVKKFESK